MSERKVLRFVANIQVLRRVAIPPAVFDAYDLKIGDRVKVKIVPISE